MDVSRLLGSKPSGMRLFHAATKSLSSLRLEILRGIGPGPCDLVFVMPQNLRGANWSGIGRWLRTVKAQQTKTLVVSGTAD